VTFAFYFVFIKYIYNYTLHIYLLLSNYTNFGTIIKIRFEEQAFLSFCLGAFRKKFFIGF